MDELYLRTETIRGNPALEPERALNLDAGVSLGDEEFPLSGDLTLFHTDIQRTILFLPRTAYLFEATNLEGAESRGLEATAELALRERYRVRLNYTLTDAHLDSTPSVQLPHHPTHRGVLATQLEFGGLGPLDGIRNLKLTGEFDARSGVNLDNFGNLTNEPFWQVDVGVEFVPTSAIRLGLQLQNVTDNRRGADHLQRPLPGRSIYASLRLVNGTLEE